MVALVVMCRSYTRCLLNRNTSYRIVHDATILTVGEFTRPESNMYIYSVARC